MTHVTHTMKAEMFSQQSKMLANRAEQSLAKALEIKKRLSSPGYYATMKEIASNLALMEKLLYVAAEFNQQANEYLEMSAKELLLATAEL